MLGAQLTMNSDLTSAAALEDDEISVKDLVLLIWRQRLLIVLTVLGCAVVAGIAAFLQRDRFIATVVISPVSQNSGIGRLGGLASQFGGLASLAGISLGGDSNKAEAVAMLQSQVLTARYVEANNLLPILFDRLWDPASKTWKVSNAADKPTLWKATQLFKNIRSVTEDRRTGLITMTVEWTDAQLCAQWANGLVKMTNDILRQKAIEESDRHIDYLNQQAGRTDLAQIRTAIYSVLESEIKNVMLAKGPGDFALRVVDPAVAPERRSSPKHLLWILGGAFAGLFFSVVIVFVRSTWNDSPDSRAVSRA